MKREFELNRKTGETDVTIKLNIDGSGHAVINTGIGFFNHMLSLLTHHGRFDLEVMAKGDLEVDSHHTVEDIGIVLGKVFKSALGEKRGIERYASHFVPMDEALVQVVVDISGRGFLAYDMIPLTPTVGAFDTETVEEFLRAFACNAEITLHVKYMSGKNAHHILEAVFKALGRSLKAAVKIDQANKQCIPSTKGIL